MKTNKIYCESCGCEITDAKNCKMYPANCGPNKFDTIYICKICDSNFSGSKHKQDEFKHVDMENGEAL